jgi:hypothetical protein
MNERGRNFLKHSNGAVIYLEISVLIESVAIAINHHKSAACNATTRTHTRVTADQ